MNRLTDRLQLMADMIEIGETMADIGTDHGFLPLYLHEKGISPKVIMCDISLPSLAKAKEAFAGRYGNSDREGYEFRGGDGLKVIGNGEVDAVVIAGMGGLLIREILQEDMNKTASFKKLILQPRNNAGQLRYWLDCNGFEIKKNLLVPEGKFICEIIVAASGEGAGFGNGKTDSFMKPEDTRWDFPPEFLEGNPELAQRYALVKLGMEEKILSGLLKSCNACEGDITAVKRRVDYYNEIFRNSKNYRRDCTG